MATQLPIIDLPQTTTQRAVARGQAAVDDLQTNQRSAQVARQQAVSVSTLTATEVGRAITQIAAAAPVSEQATIIGASEPQVQRQLQANITAARTVANAGGNISRVAANAIPTQQPSTVVNQQITQRIQVNTPGGSLPGEIQFFSDGRFAADKDFRYWSDSDTLQINGWVKTENLLVGNVANLGHVANLEIYGGTRGDVLRTDGRGNISWASLAIAGGSNNINDGNTVVSIETDSNVNFTVNNNSNVMIVTDRGAVANVFTSNNFVLGNATTTISTTRWLDAMTATVNPTVLFTTANTISSVDVHITADDGNSKQITKMLSVTKGETTTYSQYGNVTIGTEMASFYMDQSNGLVRVITRPSSSDRVDYRLVVTLYN
jgi:hypothetical protein